MDRLPEEIREKIFDYVLQDDPDTLFSLRCISKEWKIFVDEYTSRFPEWYNTCKQEIPKRCFTDIVEKIAPLSAYPWQDSFWMRSARSSTIPKDVYHAWKKLPSLMLDNFKIALIYSEPSDCIHRIIITIKDKYLVLSGKGQGEAICHVFWDMHNISMYMPIFMNHSDPVDFFTDATGRCWILLQSNNNHDVCMADFSENSPATVSGLHCGYHKHWFVAANECFTFDSDLSILAHYKFASGRFHPSEEITLPLIPESVIDSIHIHGAELRIMTSFYKPYFGMRVGIYRYKIGGTSSSKLSFTKDENNFFTEISCDLSDLSDKSTKKACLFTFNDSDVKSASLLYQAVRDGYNPRGTLIHGDNGWIRWISTWAKRTEILSAVCHANYMILGTNSGSVLIYQMTNIEGAEKNPSPPKCNVIKLKSKHISLVDIHYVELKLKIVAKSDSAIYLIDFPEEK